MTNISNAGMSAPSIESLEGRVTIPIVDGLSDQALKELNDLLPWNCFVLDSHGRQFGQPASATKRNVPQTVPDRRAVMLNERFGLADAVVLEMGCFEGIHTISLSHFAKHVKACDSRISNVVKTAVRCAMFQTSPSLFVWDVEQPAPKGQDTSCDVLFHVGVLYHLKDPVAHLRTLLPSVRRGVLLDTHYAAPELATENYSSGGTSFKARKVREGGVNEPFSGMYAYSLWLKLDDIVHLLRDAGFSKVDVLEDRQERFGPRTLIMAERGS